MPKPTADPRWATAGNKVYPGAPKMALGWELNEPPLSGHANYLLALHGDYLQYLREGILEGKHGWSTVVNYTISSAGSIAVLDDTVVPGLSDAAVLRITVTTGTVSPIESIAGGVPGRVLEIVTLGASNGSGIQLTHEHPLAAAADRILLPRDNTGAFADYTLNRDGACRLWYDGTSQRWRAMQKNR